MRLHRVRRLVAVICSLIVVFAIFGAGSVSAHDPHTNGACDVFTTMPLITGAGSSSQTHDRVGVKAIIDPYSLKTCGSGGGNSDFSAMWIGVMDSQAPQNWLRSVKLGIAECQGLSYACGFSSVPFYFYSLSGCGTSLPDIIRITSAAGNSLNGDPTITATWMQMGRSSQNNNWYMWIDLNHDGDLIDPGEQVVTIDNADPRISCWLNVHRKEARFVGERGDSGSGLGEWYSNYGHSNWFLDAKHQESPGGAFVPEFFNPQVGPPLWCPWEQDGDRQGYSYCKMGWDAGNGETDGLRIGTDFDGAGN